MYPRPAFVLLSVMILLVTATPSSGQQIKCAYQLLWTNGAVWVYNTRTCSPTGPSTCASGQSSPTILVYPQAVSPGCHFDSDGGTCACNAAVAYIAQYEDPDDYVIPPNLLPAELHSNVIDIYLFNVYRDTEEGREWYVCINFVHRDPSTFDDTQRFLAFRLSGQPTFWVENEVTRAPDSLILEIEGNPDYTVVGSGAKE